MSRLFPHMPAKPAMLTSFPFLNAEVVLQPVIAWTHDLGSPRVAHIPLML